MTPLYVGIDVSSRELEASAWVQDQVRALGSVGNQLPGFRQLARRLRKLRLAQQPIQLVVEPSGGYELALVAWAREQGWQVSLPNPWQVRRWADAHGQRSKTDAVDSRLLSRYGAAMQPQANAPLPQPVDELDQLLRRQDGLHKLLRQERNRQHSFSGHPHLSTAVNRSLQQVIESLAAALAQLEAAIAALLARHPHLAAQRRLLLSVAGVGDKTVLHLLVFLYRWHVLTQGQGDAKGLTAYAGLDPAHFRSGSSVYKPSTISKKGNGPMRSRLFAAAAGGTRIGNSPLRQFYLRLLGRHKPKKLAKVAAARKILVWAWAVFRDQVPFQAQYALPSHAAP